MANALTGTTQVSNTVIAAYDKMIEFALRGQPSFRQFVSKKPAQVTNPGESVVFQIYADLAPAPTPLDQYTDPDAVALGNTTQVTVVVNEYGNASLTTRRLKQVSIANIEQDLADIIAFNQADTVDILAQNAITGKFTTIAPTGGSGAVTVLAANSGVKYGGSAFDTGADQGGAGAATVGATHLLSSRMIRWAVTKLRSRNVVPVAGQYYACLVHPEVSVDLREETGVAGWREPNLGGENIWAGTLGTYEGAVFVENARTFNGTIGDTAARVYNSFVIGKQAIAEAVQEEPHIVFGEVTDKLKRFTPVGWYGMLGWNRYRPEAGIQLLTSSSIRPGA